MRTYLAALVTGTMLTGPAFAQPPITLPPVKIGDPVPASPVVPFALPAPAVVERPGPQPQPFVEVLPPGTVEVLPPGTVVSPPVGSQPAVRPPMPVLGAPTEVPPGPLMWTGLDYLYWRAKGGPVVPLVSAVAGLPALAVPLDAGAAFALSSDEINRGPYSGFRLSVGTWRDKPRGNGLEAVLTWFLDEPDQTTFLDAPGTALARPFLDARQGVPGLFQLSTPTGTVRGVAMVESSLDTGGLELNYLRRGRPMFGEELHWIMGFRYWVLEESLTVAAASQAGGVTATTFDTFATRNRFCGVQIGPRITFCRNDWTVVLLSKWAFGFMKQESTMLGGTSILLPGGPQVNRNGGILALGTNIGEYDRKKFALLRDMSISVGCCVAPGVTVRAGYDFLWVSTVLRPGGQIDPAVNPTLFPFGGAAPTGLLRPMQRFDGETFWMHGASIGVEVQF
jgi:Putative beta barrel porin-7 (BBP7)